MAKSKFTTTQEALDAIFAVSIPLFAQQGFNGVSIRQVANEVGVSIATLYHHFGDKQGLYIQSIDAAFKNKAEEMDKALNMEGSTEQQLQRLIFSFTRLLCADPDFERLIHREMLEGTPERLKTLVETVFAEQFSNVLNLAAKIAPDSDPNMTAMSFFSLIFFHVETAAIREFLPSHKPEHKDPDVIAQHITQFILGRPK